MSESTITLKVGDKVRFKIGRHPEEVGTVEEVGDSFLLVRRTVWANSDRCPTCCPRHDEVLEIVQ